MEGQLSDTEFRMEILNVWFLLNQVCSLPTLKKKTHLILSAYASATATENFIFKHMNPRVTNFYHNLWLISGLHSEVPKSKSFLHGWF